MSHPAFGIHLHLKKKKGFPSDASGKEPAC